MSEIVDSTPEQPPAVTATPATPATPATVAATSAAAGAVPAATGARGATTVSREVVEKIAGSAARTVPGVADLGGDVARFFNSVFDRVGLDEVGDASRGISAHVDGTSAVINVVLVIATGHVVAEVTEAVRVKVIEAVENYGLTVTAVNVEVDDIELNSPPASA